MLNYAKSSKLPLGRAASYDNVAPFYDSLSRLVYGDAIVKAHRFLVKAISANSKVLIAGGGSGRILEEITQIHSSGLCITYVEASGKMIELSKRKSTGNNKVVFINQPIQEASLLEEFDVIITPFLFDNFGEDTPGFVFEKLHPVLKPRGLWLFADFQVYRNNWWQKGMLKIMYLFFRIVCNIEATQLPDTNTPFVKHGYKIYSRQEFFKKFIYSVVYIKS